MIYFAAIGLVLLLACLFRTVVDHKRFLKRLGSKNAVIDILRGELKRIAKERQGELEEISRLRAEVKRLTPKRNVHGCFVGKQGEL